MRTLTCNLNFLKYAIIILQALVHFIDNDNYLLTHPEPVNIFLLINIMQHVIMLLKIP